jgi:hypothetical protein
MPVRLSRNVAWVWQRLEELAGIIGEGVATTQNDIVKKLREEIGQLRAEVTLLNAHKASKSDVSEGSIMSLRNRRVA